jgi:hypothetical protein
MKPHRSSKRISKRTTSIFVVALVLIAAGITIWPSAMPSLADLLNSSTLAMRSVSDQPRLVSAEPTAPQDAPMCEWQPAGLQSGYVMPVAQKMSAAEAEKHAKDMTRSYIPGEGDLAPLRVIRDTYPT